MKQKILLTLLLAFVGCKSGGSGGNKAQAPDSVPASPPNTLVVVRVFNPNGFTNPILGIRWREYRPLSKSAAPWQPNQSGEPAPFLVSGRSHTTLWMPIPAGYYDFEVYFQSITSHGVYRENVKVFPDENGTFHYNYVAWGSGERRD